MGFAAIIHQIVEQAKSSSILEWIAFILGILQVWLASKNKLLNFYAGIISVLLYIIVFYQFGLYAESLLNVYYLIVSVVGIFLWQQKKNQVLKITKTNQSLWIIASILFTLSWITLYLILKYFTPSNVPLLDAFVSAAAWIGTWLMIKRKLENWLVLSLSNIVAIPLQFYKGLELTSLLTSIYLAVAVIGYLEWKKIMQQNESNVKDYILPM